MRFKNIFQSKSITLGLLIFVLLILTGITGNAKAIKPSDSNDQLYIDAWNYDNQKMYWLALPLYKAYYHRNPPQFEDMSFKLYIEGRIDEMEEYLRWAQFLLEQVRPCIAKEKSYPCVGVVPQIIKNKVGVLPAGYRGSNNVRDTLSVSVSESKAPPDSVILCSGINFAGGCTIYTIPTSQDSYRVSDLSIRKNDVSSMVIGSNVDLNMCYLVDYGSPCTIFRSNIFRDVRDLSGYTFPANGTNINDNVESIILYRK